MRSYGAVFHSARVSTLHSRNTVTYLCQPYSVQLNFRTVSWVRNDQYFNVHNSLLFIIPQWDLTILSAQHHVFTKSSVFLSKNKKASKQQSFMIPDPTLWAWAHPYLREETLHAVHHRCEHTHTSERKPRMLYIIGVSTPILQRGNLTCCTS